MHRSLVLILLLLLACEGGAVRDPVGLGTGGEDDGTTTGGGGGSSVLLGSWKVDLLFEVTGDIQRHTTTWNFATDGACRRTVEIYSVLEDRTLRTTTYCTFRSGSGEVAITYEGNSNPVVFRWELEGFSRNRLILDGVIYDRIG